jgi:hypothetical protein
MVGLGQWHNIPLALAVEPFVLLVGLGRFLPGAALSRSRKAWLAALSLLVLAFTVAGMTIAPPPASATAMASSSLITIAVVCTIVWWLSRPRH